MSNKKKLSYAKGYKVRVFNTIPESTLLRIKACIKVADYTPSRLLKEFKVSLPDSWAQVVYDEYRPADTSPIAKMGHKNEPYHTKEFPVIPMYKLKDLTGQEKVIAKKDTSTKLWTWEE